MKSQKPRNFGEFWPIYMTEHRLPGNRRLHFIGTLIGFVLLGAAAIEEQPWLVFAAVLIGYGCAWVGHYYVEHNRPATFRYPVYSLLGDFKMFYLILNRKMDAELERLHLDRLQMDKR